MASASLHNRHGFFSDYWLGTMLARRETAAPKLTAAKLQRLHERVGTLYDRVNGLQSPDLTGFRERFARPLLAEVLDFHLAEPLDGIDTRLRTLHATAADSTAVVGLLLCPEPERLDQRETRQTLESYLEDRGLPYGILLTPQTLRLVRRRGEGARGAAFDVALHGIVEQGDRDSLETARRLLHSGNFLPREGGAVSIVAEMEAESLKHRAKVSSALKSAVFQAAEIVIRGIRADFAARRDDLPPEPPLPVIRDIALLVLYRLLFILYAESRDPRLQHHPLYRRVYSLESLVDRLLRTPHDALARNRCEHWSLLQATFRIFNDGLPPLPDLENIPPRGGPLFSATEEAGAWIERLRLCDADVAALLFALATAKPRRGVGRERISYRELAIEQLGSVYEGLLEHEPRVADTTLFALRVAGREFVLAPGELLRLCRERNLALSGPEELLSHPAISDLYASATEEEGGDESDVEDDPAEPSADDVDESEEEETAIAARAAAKLVRRLDPGDFYFAPGGARKSSGSYYTVDQIVDDLCHHALGGLVENASPERILSLRVIDIACGSAHFLVGAARWLGRALWQAYQSRHGDEPPPDFLPDRIETRRQQDWPVEGEAWCKRRVVERCLYGVDLNPTAVQLARVALWIESLAGDRPLSFFAHHIRCGNALLGSTLENFTRPPLSGLGGDAGIDLFVGDLAASMRRALDERRLIDAPLPAGIPADQPAAYEYKADRLRRAEEAVDRVRLLFDLRSASAFLPVVWSEFPNLVSSPDPRAYAETRPWWAEYQTLLGRERFFHWELEFPEVFLAENPGFDAVLGNPPWEKVKPDRKEFYAREDVLIRAFSGGALDARIRELEARRPALPAEFAAYEERLKTLAASLMKGGDYRHHEWVVAGRRTGGDPDLFKFFIERAFAHLRVGGYLGYLVPSAVYNTDGCTGVRHLLLDHARIHRFFGFENRTKIFSIDSRYKFVCLAAEKLPPDEAAPEGFDATFMRLDLEELETGPPPDALVPVRRAELAEFSPGTLALLEFRSVRDREIVLKMSGLLEGHGPPRPLLGGHNPESWGARYGAEFHMTNDRALWTRPDGRLWTPREVCGLDWPGDPAIPFAEIRAAMAREGFWPLYEGKHIDQWLADTKPVARWLSLEACETVTGGPPSPGPKLVFRDIASNTNERTCIAAVLEEGSCANNKIPTISFAEISPDAAAVVLNSLCFDWLLRFRISSTINWTYISRVPVPPAASVRRLPVVPSRSAAAGAWTGRTASDRICLANDPDQWETLWRVERAVAEAYGLAPADFAHLLQSFPVHARKRAGYHGYLETKTAAWAAE